MSSSGSKRQWLFLICGLVAWTITACTPDVTFLSDPLFGGILRSREQFEEELTHVARNHGARMSFVWPETELLDQVDFVALVGGLDTTTVLLSPYASLSIDELAPRFPERHFVSLAADSAKAENVTRVQFDWRAGWQNAGLIAGAWASAENGRTVVVLTSDDDLQGREHAAAFGTGVTATGATHEIEVLRGSPTSDSILTAIGVGRDPSRALVVLMLGSGNTLALAQLRDRGVLIALGGVQIEDGDSRILLSVQADFVAALDAHLASPGERSLVIPATVEVNSALFEETDQAD